MVPLSKNTESSSREGPSIHNSWYIGAFGKWWRGGVFEEWYQDVITRSKDEESWSSGILSMKRLDMLQDYNGLSFIHSKIRPHPILAQRQLFLPRICQPILREALLLSSEIVKSPR